jgi:hypothetical protein
VSASIWVCAAGVGAPSCCACSHFAYAARVCDWSCCGGFGCGGQPVATSAPPRPHRREIVVGGVILLNEHDHPVDDLRHAADRAPAEPTQANDPDVCRGLVQQQMSSVIVNPVGLTSRAGGAGCAAIVVIG